MTHRYEFIIFVYKEKLKLNLLFRTFWSSRYTLISDRSLLEEWMLLIQKSVVRIPEVACAYVFPKLCTFVKGKHCDSL